MGNKYSGPDRLPVPDYKTYVVGDHTPELKTLEERLRKKGLKVKAFTCLLIQMNDWYILNFLIFLY